MTRFYVVVAIIIFLMLLCIFAFLMVSLDSRTPNQETVQAWQQSFKEALIKGYTNFDGHLIDSDAAVYIFSYQIPAGLKSQQALSLLRQQLGDFKIVSESGNELVIHRSLSYAPEGFDEYRFVVDEQQRKVTVMFAKLDSPTKIKYHPSFIEKFAEAQRVRAPVIPN